MIHVDPVTLEFNGVRLEPPAPHHLDGLRAAARTANCGTASRSAARGMHGAASAAIVRGEWHEIKSHLHYRLARHAE